ncbi:MAG: glycosyltransferase family 2 protein [Candidatus Eiseniibacteriota bacterium]|jgi:glycosyltransferase involved in cell wall biosynthesis
MISGDARQPETAPSAAPTAGATAAAPPLKLSVIIPVYNECATISEIIEKVNRVPVTKEIIVIDDGSRDGTADILRRKLLGNEVSILHTSLVNLGKGASIRFGLEYVRGDIVLIQDADLELDPSDYVRILEEFVRRQADVVYGSRFLGKGYFRAFPNVGFASKLANCVLAWMVRLLWRVKLTDEATSYKAFRTAVIKSMDLKCVGFEFCPEVTAKVLNRGYPIYEVPIQYHPRTVAEGKKVRWFDGIKAVYVLLKYRFIARDE